MWVHLFLWFVLALPSMSQSRESVSNRSHVPSTKVKENMEAHKELIDEFWKVMEGAKDCSPANYQDKLQEVHQIYEKTRTALGDVMPTDMRHAADRAIASFQYTDTRSHSPTLSNASVTSSRRALLESERAALAVETKAKQVELQKLAALSKLEVEESARHAD